MNVELRDVNTIWQAQRTHVEVRADGPTGELGIGIYVENHSTKTAVGEHSEPIAYLEICDGKPILRVWADIDSEEPTHTIDLSRAHRPAGQS